MELRKKKKAPVYYDDVDFRNPQQEEVFFTPSKSAKKLGYTGLPIDYNPNLRPAAFPTIPHGHQVDLEVEDVTRPTPPATNKALATSSAASSSAQFLQAPTVAVSLRQRQSQAYNSALPTPNMFTQADKDEWAQRLAFNAGRSPSPDRRAASHGLLNPVLAGNYALMNKFGKRTDVEWVAAEMATSDEEDDEPRGRQMVNRSAPTWDNISVVLQLDLVDSTMEKYESLEAAFRKLRLRHDQRPAMIEHLQIRNNYLKAEEDLISKALDQTDKILLNCRKKDVDYFANGGGHESFLQQYLYRQVDGKGYQFATGRELESAKAYLFAYGLRLNLDHWVDATDDPMAIQSGNKTLPRAAYPVQTRARASIQEREAEQLIIPAKPAQPPVAAFSRPLPSLPAKETPRAVSSTRAIHTHEPEPPSTRRLLSQPPRRRLSSNAQSRPRPNMSFSNGIVPNAETNGNEEAVERTTQKQYIEPTSNEQGRAWPRADVSSSIAVTLCPESKEKDEATEHAVLERTRDRDPDTHAHPVSRLEQATLDKEAVPTANTGRVPQMIGQSERNGSSEPSTITASREAYVPPALARNFVLPPQFSVHGQDWVPNTRPSSSSSAMPEKSSVVPTPSDHGHNAQPDSNSGLSQLAVAAGSGPTAGRDGVQGSYRQNPITQTLYDHDGNILPLLRPNVSQEFQALDQAYARIEQQNHTYGSQTALPSFRDLQLPSSAYAAPPPLSVRPDNISPILGYLPQRRSVNPFEMSYSTVDQGLTAAALSPMFPQQYPIFMQPMEHISGSEQHQQSGSYSVEIQERSSSSARASSVTTNSKRAVAENDADDDYVPPKKVAKKAPAKTPAKAPAKAKKKPQRRKTTVC